MALTDYKITETDVNPVRVVGRTSTLQGTVEENQQVFDDYSDMIVDKFNNLVEYLGQTSEVVIDDEVIELYRSMGWTTPTA